MARDYEDAVNLDQMTDSDVRGVVRQRLDEDADFDVDAVDVKVTDGRITVDGRVGTEGERQHVEQVLTALGAHSYANNVVVDETRRAERAEAADVARAEDAEARSSLGEAGKETSDTAEHLLPDDAGDLYGTGDVQKAIQEGQSYTPPDGPTQEGIDGREGHPEGERH
jgi:hypothetical protein